MYLAVGPDRLAELVEPFRRRFATQCTKKAEAMKKMAQAGSDCLARFVEKLPERWRERTEVPQSCATAQTDAGLEGGPDPFDRLATERERDFGQVGAGSSG